LQSHHYGIAAEIGGLALFDAYFARRSLLKKQHRSRHLGDIKLLKNVASESRLGDAESEERKRTRRPQSTASLKIGPRSGFSTGC